MHFYESSIITTVDGLHCQVYSNEHPLSGIIVKPKYIPTEKISSDAMPYRFISGKKMNRLNMWTNKEELKSYVNKFKENYPDYVFTGHSHDKGRLFFIVPISKIEKIYSPKKGLSELMQMPANSLDPYLKNVHEFINLLLKSGLTLDDLGITYSTLMGHYLLDVSDINVVVYGKNNYWKLMNYLKDAEHNLLRWKTEKDWMEFYKRRNRFSVFTKEEFLNNFMHKKSEGYFNNSLFVLFAVEKEGETWFKWGSESYSPLGLVTVEADVSNNFNSVVRPGCYEVENSKIIHGHGDMPVKKIVFYSRDYCMLANRGGKIRACGLLEKVKPRNGKVYYRVVVGYFDAYITERREKEYIKVIDVGVTKWE